MFGPHQWQFLLFKCTSKVKFFMFCILVPWCKRHVSIHIYTSMFNSNTKCSFFMLPFYCALLAMFGVKCKPIQLLCNTFSSSIGTQWNNNHEEKDWDHFNLFLLSFSFLDPKVNNFDNTHGCPLRNQNDISNNLIPCKLTLSV